MIRRLALVATLALAACSTSPAAINATKVALTAAEKAATVYVRLPLCPQPSGLLCSDAGVSAKIKVADQRAFEGVQAMSDGKLSVEEATSLITSLVILIPVQK